MGLCTIEPRTATSLLQRLSEVERIKIRGANDGVLAHMAANELAADRPTLETLREVQQELSRRMAASTVAKQMDATSPDSGVSVR